MLLYYITSRTAFSGDESNRCRLLLEKVAEAARAGVNYIQLREKDLPGRELEHLAKSSVEIIEGVRNPATGNRETAPALLINSRADVAWAGGAAGVHLRSVDISPVDVRQAWAAGSTGKNSPRPLTISISCHAPEEVAKAAEAGADLALFGPVFGKKDTGARGTGLARLREACANRIPVLALGGVTLENARDCLDAGAAGIAAIRLFQENDIGALVDRLRS